MVERTEEEEEGIRDKGFWSLFALFWGILEHFYWVLEGVWMTFGR